jgi:hypothetical protein
MLPHAISTLRAPSNVSGTLEPGSQPVEVRRALPPPVKVRRALPAVPRALPVSSTVSTVSNAEWQPVTLPDGTTVQVRYQGELPSSAALPLKGALLARSGRPAPQAGSGRSRRESILLPGRSLPTSVQKGAALAPALHGFQRILEVGARRLRLFRLGALIVSSAGWGS